MRSHWIDSFASHAIRNTGFEIRERPAYVEVGLLSCLNALSNIRHSDFFTHHSYSTCALPSEYDVMHLTGNSEQLLLRPAPCVCLAMNRSERILFNLGSLLHNVDVEFFLKRKGLIPEDWLTESGIYDAMDTHEKKTACGREEPVARWVHHLGVGQGGNHRRIAKENHFCIRAIYGFHHTC
jgi:hypothetical protein